MHNDIRFLFCFSGKLPRVGKSKFKVSNALLMQHFFFFCLRSWNYYFSSFNFFLLLSCDRISWLEHVFVLWLNVSNLQGFARDSVGLLIIDFGNFVCGFFLLMLICLMIKVANLSTQTSRIEQWWWIWKQCLLQIFTQRNSNIR